MDGIDGDRSGDTAEHQDRRDYLLPRPTNIRRVFVDNSTTPVSFWAGSNDGASIVKVEPLD
ncbi:MAG: hypothetical protein JOY90_26840 [Bradyrhizobium sp.]|uniref:hypothetical protein n=1 Tax=Bradyrhizobium sp. TaxID=376 RepID=UPI001D642263|nr:hypothetical protein [Bradyrhizobium sp.]MBV9564033.1 hypothetical protein [Bradyrhizobium sp.]